ncbi:MULTISPECIES: tyrosine-protein phosphatase [unclassified Sphingopyxis]|uniref:tyrosine-protein phosphatase n=1 Tax=unclassified Sphingopyxis TaxID=2614943 RepID=UPI002859DE21|nr:MULTISPECIES: tyrosine-protein phosphatase [unclassified Sphingopyxis]MDR7059303.1 protein-tyrosine phosphatase [Sphingopyxis sp. BE235]MDR7178511.1 protein-tyrosine phosphatase [Sphingopyxis sp. BE249]
MKKALFGLLLLTPTMAIAQHAPTAAHTDPATTRTREIALTGGDNFRDIGGYRTKDGHSIAWGKLYRSASVGRYTADDQALVRKLGVGSIIDLRSTRERQTDKTPWMRDSGLGYWARDYDLSGGNLGALFAKGTTLDAGTMRGVMIQGYRGFPKEQAASYRMLFDRLLTSDKAVIVNCTAGKDRTGVGVALVLSALGVPYDTIMEDYLLSNSALDMEALRADAGMNAAMSALPADVAKPLLGVERAYLDAAFDQIRKDYGDVDTYLARELGVDSKALQRLRKQMLR